MKRFYLTQPFGCHLNKLDTARIRSFLLDNGLKETTSIKAADVLIINTCSFIKDRVRISVEAIDDINRKRKKGSLFIVGGCLPRIDLETLRKHHKGPIFDPHSLDQLDKLLDARKSIMEQPLSQRMIIKDEISRTRDITFIRINYGCTGRCSFCAVKKVFPRLISRSPDDIISEFRAKIKGGCRDIGLTSEDVTAYGLDIGTDLVSLLRRMVREKGNYRISLYRLHPDLMIKRQDELFRIFRSGKIAYLSIPVNSGSQKITRLMRRNYDVEEIKKFIIDVNKKFPKIKIRLDFMVGFPGETKDDFEQTRAFVNQCRSDVLFVYEFSPMPGTEAASMKNPVSSFTIRKRAEKLRLEHLMKHYNSKLYKNGIMK